MITYLLVFLAGAAASFYPVYKLGMKYGVKISSAIAKAEEEAYKAKAYLETLNRK